MDGERIASEVRHTIDELFERADITSNTYYDWVIDHAYLIYGGQSLVAQFAATFEEFPPRGKAASFTVGDALEKIKSPRSH